MKNLKEFNKIKNYEIKQIKKSQDKEKIIKIFMLKLLMNLIMLHII